MKRPRRQRRTERQRTLQVVIRATSLIVALAAIVYVALTAASGLPGTGAYKVNVRVRNAYDIVKNSPVWIAGHQVGQVTGGTTNDGVADLHLSLTGVASLPSDTTAQIRYTSLLGALALQLTPGHSTRRLPAGGTIPVRQTTSTTELPDALTALAPPRRSELRSTLEALGAGFLGRGQELGQTITQAPAFLSDLTSTSQAILQRTDAAQRFFPSLDSLSVAADPVRAQIAHGFGPEGQVLEAFASPQANLAELLQSAPTSLSGIRSGLAATDPLLGGLHRLAVATQSSLDAAPAALRETSALLAQANAPLRHLRPVLLSAGAVVPTVLQFTGQLNPVIGHIRDGVSDPITIMQRLDQHTCDFEAWAHHWRSMLGYSPIGSPSTSASGPLNLLRVQFESIGISQTLGNQTTTPIKTGQDAYPAPCTASGEHTS